MRRRPLFWLMVSMACFIGAFYFWRLGDRWAEKARTAAPVSQPSGDAAPATNKPADHARTVPIRLLSDGGNLNSPAPEKEPMANINRPSRTAFRLSNTSQTVGQLARNPKAVLLENALIDTSKSPELALPDHLRVKDDPGAYIVQSRSTLNAAFREYLEKSGATIISYIPNNAYLVRASATVARRLEAGAQSVLPYEPYYKLKASLLRSAVEQTPLPPETALNVLLFADARQITLKALEDMGAKILSEDRSPFGPVVKVRALADSLSQVAGLPGVQEIEPARYRIPANDLSRPVLGVSVDTVVPTNYMGLTGTNVLVALADTGVDTNHPDLLNTFSDVPISGVDSNGHGTHVAGVIVGSGAHSTTVTNASGSVLPPVDGQFRGKAPGARLFSMLFNESDTYLEETAAKTNALISNNSWHFGANEYDLGAANYDAAVRDSLPLVSGMQSLIYVFAAGNSGGGDNNGTSGQADSILSPATGKNVITVGAFEQPRLITNEVYKCSTVYGEFACRTNAPWKSETDTGDEVAAFSSRGNVGVHIEGDNGRFKPDVVAPGTFVISTQSGQWDTNAYYNNTSHLSRVWSNLEAQPGDTWLNSVFIPDNAIQVTISVVPNRHSPNPMPDLPVLVRQATQPTNAPGGYDFLGTNEVQMPRDLPLDPLGVDWWYGVANVTTQAVSFDVVTDIIVTNELGNYNEVLMGLNDALGPYYRYESGTSMAAGSVSGMLALMEEFFLKLPVPRTNSPALMKALLINGARSLGNLYDLQVRTAMNAQGWGVPKLPNCIPASLAAALSNTTAAASSMFIFDQSPTNVVATGERRTIKVEVAPEAKTDPLRVTLVWTDPPGNPVASFKLVNDLDLIVTNLDTGDVFFGNDIGAGNDFNAPWDTNTLPNIDFVNNVENVYLSPDLGTNYSITVLGSRVNVNAVTAHTNDIVQDYALVISSGDGLVSNALTMVDAPVVSQEGPSVMIVTNMFADSPDMSGAVLLNQHAGANSPLLGTNTIPLQDYANGVLTLGQTNQWHFYVITNEHAYTNAAFLTFIPPTLSVPVLGTREFDTDNATRPEADIDLYVSTDPTLTNLSPTAVDGAYKSLTREGTETIILSNAVAGVYYIGVKSEDHMAAEYGLLAAFSLNPFSASDAEGNQYLRGFPVPAPIPDATLDSANNIVAGVARIFAFGPGPQLVRRVVVTNVLSHELVGDLIGTLTHNGRTATLNNHTTNLSVLNLTYVYDDSGENDGAQRSDGPGTLEEFAGRPGTGQWQFLQSDGAVGHIGTNGSLFIFLEKQQDLTEGITYTLKPGACRSDFVEIPNDATNLTIDVAILEGSGPVSVEVCPLDGTGSDCKSTVISNAIGGSVSVDIYDDPPLHPGVYRVRLCNLGTEDVTVHVLARIMINPFRIANSISSAGGAVPILDDAVTYSYLTNFSHLRISSLDVSMLLNHPRISDLAMTLISPNGTRILLFEDRGAVITNGLGTFSGSTNSLSSGQFEYTNMPAFYTNDFERAAPGLYVPGAQFQGWDVTTNNVAVVQDFSRLWLSNNILVLGDGSVSTKLPTTNATSYNVSWKVTHAPFLVGTLGWWPLDGDARDIFGGFDGLLSGGANNTNGYIMWRAGEVDQAFYGDAVRAGILVPKCPDLDVGLGRGFTVEGWINPTNFPTMAETNYTVPGTANVFSAGLRSAFSGTLPTLVPVDPSGGGFQFQVSGTVDPNGSMYNLSGGEGIPNVPTSLNSYGGISGFKSDQAFCFTGVFLSSSAPISPAPATLDFNPTGIGRNFVTLSPELGQVFYIGNGRTDSGQVQTFIPPQGATRLLLGFPDGYNFQGTPGQYADNTGSLTVTVGTPSGPALTATNRPTPIAEWNDPTNPAPQGVQFWLSGLSYTNPLPGALTAAIWDTNLQPHFIQTSTNAITNGGWQHVALTFDASTLVARIYTNGQLAAVTNFTGTNIVARTSGNLYFGFHPDNNADVAGFRGGVDEMGLYSRPLSDCEIEAIYNAGSRGKYGTNVLTCPVAYQVTVQSDTTTTLIVTNGLWWTNGPQWEGTNIDFTNPILSATTNGPGTNLTQITFTPFDPNVAIDDVVLSGLVTNVVNGLLHFTDNTNDALVPIKFAPTPYVMSNNPPARIFTNDFENVLPGLFGTGDTITGTTNSPEIGVRDWTVTQGAVTVVSNTAVDAIGTNSLALARGSVACNLPTIPGRRYQLSYALRGPGAVGWWNGDVEPLSRRARDLIGDNHGAFFYDASSTNGLSSVGANSLWFPGLVEVTNQLASKVEIGDPENLHLTNAITIEGWIYPVPQTNNSFVPEKVEQIFFRGDSRDCRDPYYFGIEQTSPTTFDLIFHVENADLGNCGVILETADQPLVVNEWQHVAGVFEANVPYTNDDGSFGLTNELRMYLNGVLLTNVFLEDPSEFGAYLTSYTSAIPSANLEPSFSPGVAIGNRSRMDNSEPYRGYIDELTVYGRALSDPEIAAIARAGRVGKADVGMPPTQSLAKANVWLDNTLMSTGWGDNSHFTETSFEFTAMRSNLTLTVQSLLPGTMLDYVTLTEMPAELSYQPEQSLDSLIGEDAYGIWTLEIWDTRAGATNNDPQLAQWQLDFRLLPSANPLPAYLSHGIPYSNTLPGYGTQNLIVEVPQWAYFATNDLLSATNRNSGFDAPVGVLFDLTNQVPDSLANTLFWPPVSSGTNVLTTNTALTQWLVPGQPYYLTVTNENPYPVTYTYGVWFDILSLTNCEAQTNFVGPAGIPRYFQFDVPTNYMMTDIVQQVSFWLTGAQSNLTVVLSQNLPLPDLGHYDYIGRQPSTNDEIVMMVTNTTPFAIQTNRWYVGIFNSTATNVPFTAQACSATNFPVLVQLTNRVPFTTGVSNIFAAPPGPPRLVFFEFDVTNYTDALLFELYGLSGDADLVLQRDVPPTMSPYYAGSFRLGTTPEQIVLRVGREIPDLRGKWFLGVYNNETNNVGFTIRAATPDPDSLLNSGQPLVMTIAPPAGPHRMVIQWNSVVGEYYVVETASRLYNPDWHLLIGTLFRATTPFSAIELPIGVTGAGYYRIRHVPRNEVLGAPLSIQLWTNNTVRISWSTAFQDYTLQYSDVLPPVWANVNLPVVTEGNEYVVYDTIGSVSRFYRLVPP